MSKPSVLVTKALEALYRLESALPRLNIDKHMSDISIIENVLCKLPNDPPWLIAAKALFERAGRQRFHGVGDCERADSCCLHAPSDHHMQAWALNWRGDRQLMERICEHGVGHPDPDHMSRHARLHGKKDMEFEGIHGCDGCCRIVLDNKNET